MIAVAISAALGLAALAWYMQRRPPARVSLSFARLMPDPPDEPSPKPRFAPIPPVRSLPFWLHLLLVALCIAALVTDVRVSTSNAPQDIGLRLVVDVSHSMGVQDETGTRLDSALGLARTILAAATEAAQGGTVCVDAFQVGADVSRMQPDHLDAARVRPEAGDIPTVLQAARADPDLCVITHVAVLTDLPRPAVDWPTDAPQLIWAQVGLPQPNAGIAGVAYSPPQLGGRPAGVVLTLETYGDMPPPVVTVQGPGGVTRPMVMQAIDRSGRYLASFDVRRGGTFDVALDNGGAYVGDDHLRFSLNTPDKIGIDWRISGLPAVSAGSRKAENDIVVMALTSGDLVPQGNAVLLAYQGWPRETVEPRIGAFVEDPALFDPINFDVLERHLPQGLTAQLPTGFIPELTSDDGAVIVARRDNPPGLILPLPVLTGDPDVQALSQTLFFTGLQRLTQRGDHQVTPIWKTPDGTDIETAWKESDTARPLFAPSEVRFSMRPAEIARDTPIWPWLLLFALVSILAERLWLLSQSLTRKPVR